MVANVKISDGHKFLFLSEQFSQYPGWRAFLDGKEGKILSSNGIFSAVYIGGNRNVEIVYYPSSFKKGIIISALTIGIIAIFFLTIIFHNKILKMEKK